MARVTIADCTPYISSRFELVILAAQRAKDIAAGSPILITKEKNDKHPVLALREIAAGLINADNLREALIKKFQKYKASDVLDKPEDDMNEDQMEILREVKSFENAEDHEEMGNDIEQDEMEDEEIEEDNR